MATAKTPNTPVAQLPADVREMIEDGPILVCAVISKGQRYETKRPRSCGGRSFLDGDLRQHAIASGPMSVWHICHLPTKALCGFNYRLIDATNWLPMRSVTPPGAEATNLGHPTGGLVGWPLSFWAIIPAPLREKCERTRDAFRFASGFG